LNDRHRCSRWHTFCGPRRMLGPRPSEPEWFGRTSSGGHVGRFAGFAVLVVAYQSERSREDGRRPSSPGGRRRGAPGSGPDLRGISGETVVSLLFFPHPFQPASARPPRPPRPLPYGGAWRPYGGARVFPHPPLPPCLSARRFFLTRQGIDAPLHVRPLHARSGIGGFEESPRPILRGGMPVRVL